ncbi:MAG: hypothetical protein ACE5QV_08755, partial [Fidelibacterota bacterium]
MNKEGFNSILIFSFICAILFVGIVKKAHAIPAFARKYRTSCVTCHISFPKLTPFGEAFRNNGFQWSVDDEEYVKEKPLKLGAEAYKRVFPDAVWPGSIPGIPPVSFRAKGGLRISPSEEVKSSFIPPTLQFLAAGTLGENITFFAGAHLFEENEIGSIDRFYIKLDNLLTNYLPYYFFNIRIGQFIPELVPFASNHRGTTITPYAFNTYNPTMDEFPSEHVHEAGFGIEGFQIGTELSGIISSRFRYVLGIVNGNGPGVSATGESADHDHEASTNGEQAHPAKGDNNSAKDLYFRVSYKLGGMGYDGSGGEFSKTGKSRMEKSFAIGIFGYSGKAKDDVTEKNLSIKRIGTDFNWFMGDLNLYGGFISGADEVIGHDGEIEEKSYNLLFSEANYMVYPWLMAVLRWEHANLVNNSGIQRFVPNLSILLRANIKISVE